MIFAFFLPLLENVKKDLIYLEGDTLTFVYFFYVCHFCTGLEKQVPSSKERYLEILNGKIGIKCDIKIMTSIVKKNTFVNFLDIFEKGCHCLYCIRKWICYEFCDRFEKGGISKIK